MNILRFKSSSLCILLSSFLFCDSHKCLKRHTLSFCISLYQRTQYFFLCFLFWYLICRRKGTFKKNINQRTVLFFYHFWLLWKNWNSIYNSVLIKISILTCIKFPFIKFLQWSSISINYLSYFDGLEFLWFNGDYC